MPHPVLLQPEFYHEKLQSLFGEWALVWLKQQKSVSEGFKKATEIGLNPEKVKIEKFNF